MFGRQLGVPRRHHGLNFVCEAQRIDGAAELGQEPIAGRFDEPSIMIRDRRVDYFGADGPKPFKRALLVRPNKARVARHICGEYGSKASSGGHRWLHPELRRQA